MTAPGYQPYAPQALAKPRRKVRVFTWVILAINVLFLIWVIAGAASASGHADHCGGLSQKTCDDARDAGTAIGVGIIVVFWALVDVILGVVWLVTRKREPAIVYVQQAPGYGPPPMGAWHADPRNPSLVRWHDGQQWTEHTQPRVTH